MTDKQPEITEENCHISADNKTVLIDTYDASSLQRRIFQGLKDTQKLTKIDSLINEIIADVVCFGVDTAADRGKLIYGLETILEELK